MSALALDGRVSMLVWMVDDQAALHSVLSMAVTPASHVASNVPLAIVPACE